MTKTKEDRGEFRSIYAVIVDSPEFQSLSGIARACFWPLKMRLGKAGIAVFEIEALPKLVGFERSPCEGAVGELIETSWLEVEHNVFWLRNGLRFEPSDPLASPNGRKGIENFLKTLPKLEIVNRFARYYGLEVPFPAIAPSKPLRSPFEAQKTEDRRQKTERKDAVSTKPGPSPAGVHAREAETPPPEDVHRELAPLIREHLWLGKKPPPASARDGPWTLGRDLQIAKRLMAERGIPLDEMCEVVRHARAVLQQPTDAKLTMRIFNVNGRGDRLEDVLGYVRKRREREAAERGLEPVDQLIR